MAAESLPGEGWDKAHNKTGSMLVARATNWITSFENGMLGCFRASNETDHVFSVSDAQPFDTSIGCIDMFDSNILFLPRSLATNLAQYSGLKTGNRDDLHNWSGQFATFLSLLRRHRFTIETAGRLRASPRIFGPRKFHARTLICHRRFEGTK